MKKQFNYLCFLTLCMSMILFSACSNEDSDIFTDKTDKTDISETQNKISFNDFKSTFENVGGNMELFNRLNADNVTKIINLGLTSDLKQSLLENGVNGEIINNNRKNTKLLGGSWYVEANEKLPEHMLRIEYPSKEEIVMITTDAAKHANINSGYYVVQEIRAHNMFYSDNITSDFVMLDSPECGYIYAQWGLGTIKDKQRGYQVRPVYGDNGSRDMSATFMHVLRTKGGATIDKWIPCHPTEAIWRYGYIFTMGDIIC